MAAVWHDVKRASLTRAFSLKADAHTRLSMILEAGWPPYSQQCLQQKPQLVSDGHLEARAVISKLISYCSLFGITGIVKR